MVSDFRSLTTYHPTTKEEAMKKALAIALVLLLTLMFAPALSRAQESDINPAWLKGTWRGTSPSPAIGEDQHEYIIAEDGTFKGDIHSVRGGWIDVSGSYRIESGKLTLEGIYKNGPQAIYGKKFEINLIRKGEILEGEGHSYYAVKRSPASLRRVK